MKERSIFIEAPGRRTGAGRAAYPDEACAGDTRLRQRVEALLRSHEGGDFLEKLAPQRVAEALETHGPPSEIRGEPPDGGRGRRQRRLGHRL